MITSRFRHLLLSAWIVLATVTVSACKSGPSGTYHDANGAITLEFKSGKAYLTMLGETKELTYKVEGSKITLHAPADAAGDNLVLTKNGDGSLSGPMGTLTKK